MRVKTKKNTARESLSKTKGDILNYQPGSLPWGLEASYQSYKLVFEDRQSSGLDKFFSFFGMHRGQKFGSANSNVNLYNLLSNSAQHAWKNSYAIAHRHKRPLAVEDIFLALLEEPSVKNLLLRIKVDGKQAKAFIEDYLKLTRPLTDITVKKIPFEAFALAAKLHNHKIGSLMLLGGLLKATPHDNILQAIFSNIGLNAAKLELMSVWILDLDYEFPANSTSNNLLFCLNQARGLEQHFGYFFELPAIEAALNFSQGQTLKDLEHLKALQVMVRAGLLAQNKGTKIITKNFIEQAAGK
jgi:hypothetical protein